MLWHKNIIVAGRKEVKKHLKLQRFLKMKATFEEWCKKESSSEPAAYRRRPALFQKICHGTHSQFAEKNQQLQSKNLYWNKPVLQALETFWK